MVIRSPTERYLLGAGITQDPSFPVCPAPVRSKQPGEDRVTPQDESGGTDQDIDNPGWLFVPPTHACPKFKGCPINTGHCASWPGHWGSSARGQGRGTSIAPPRKVKKHLYPPEEEISLGKQQV